MNECQKPHSTEENQDREKIQSPHFVGLKNQGATCYMNCILQSLFYLPIFHQLICQTSHEEQNVIVNELRHLFFKLETSSKNAVSTKSLTRSFGWSHDDAFIPQDPHHFLHWLLVDILMKDYETEIKNIFEGLMKTTIHNEKGRKKVNEVFYDLSMVVKNCNSLEQSFEVYIEPDIMRNDAFKDIIGNEMSCTKIKTTFLKFPKVLYLHLNRTEFNFGNRKINSYFSFNESLDISHYLDKKHFHSGSTLYKLYGVIVHHGPSAIDGHYYAFLKILDKNEWYKFNDSAINKSSPMEAIESNYGGKNKEYIIEDHFMKSYSAYILIYIQENEIPYVYNQVNFPKPKRQKQKNVQITIINEKSLVLNLI